MPVPKTDFEALYPCDFYTPEELLDPELMYTIEELARLLQGLDPDAEVPPETVDVLVDWTIPWIVDNAADLVIADPRREDEPGYYGVKVEDDGDDHR